MQAMQELSLLVVSAAPGYGKSCIGRELAKLCGRKSYSISIPSGLSEERQLWQLISSQLSAQGFPNASDLPEFGEQVEPVLLRNLLQHWKECSEQYPVLLLIDDYQRAPGQNLDLIIEAVARERIPNLCVVVLTRERPNVHLEDLKIKGLAAYFDQELLRFTREEAVELFQLNDVVGLQPVEEAWRISEGWAAVLCMSLSSYISDNTIEATVAIDKFIAETFLNDYSEKEQTTLLRLAALDSFTLEQGVFMLNVPDAAFRIRN
ncbi:hypothetical protein LJC59_10105, partial [Desulfovibrio sp. OttesenSCG-928-A18]|nr:hypothetical protein [Desulfovibrio sp. OttesenSCG-928-A18]